VRAFCGAFDLIHDTIRTNSRALCSNSVVFASATLRSVSPFNVQQNMISPEVSICIPTYNGREHLKECIDSVRVQTFGDFEVLICDDQSSDGSLDYARELAKGDTRFRFVANPRRFGLVGNWNNCVKQARGEWIKFVFQDDIIAPTCVEKLLRACKTTGKPFSFCGRDFIFDDAVSEELRNWFAGHWERLHSDYDTCPVIDPDQAALKAIREPMHNQVGEPTVTLINRSVFRQLGKFDEALVQLCDAEFWTRVMINRGAVFLPENLATFRIHAKATTALNHSKRVYRTAVLDPMVIRYRFAFGRHFKAMRNPQLTGKTVLSLRGECASVVAYAWKQAERPIETAGLFSGNSIAEWRSVTSHHLGLQILAVFGRIFHFYRAMRTRIGRRVGRLINAY